MFGSIVADISIVNVVWSVKLYRPTIRFFFLSIILLTMELSASSFCKSILDSDTSLHYKRDCLKKQLARSPNDIDVRLNYAKTLLAYGKIKAAYRHIREINVVEIKRDEDIIAAVYAAYYLKKYRSSKLYSRRLKSEKYRNIARVYIASIFSHTNRRRAYKNIKRVKSLPEALEPIRLELLKMLKDKKRKIKYRYIIPFIPYRELLKESPVTDTEDSHFITDTSLEYGNKSTSFSSSTRQTQDNLTTYKAKVSSDYKVNTVPGQSVLFGARVSRYKETLLRVKTNGEEKSDKQYISDQTERELSASYESLGSKDLTFSSNLSYGLLGSEDNSVVTDSRFWKRGFELASNERNYSLNLNYSGNEFRNSNNRKSTLFRHNESLSIGVRIDSEKFGMHINHTEIDSSNEAFAFDHRESESKVSFDTSLQGIRLNAYISLVSRSPKSEEKQLDRAILNDKKVHITATRGFFEMIDASISSGFSKLSGFTRITSLEEKPYIYADGSRIFASSNISLNMMKYISISHQYLLEKYSLQSKEEDETYKSFLIDQLSEQSLNANVTYTF